MGSERPRTLDQLAGLLGRPSTGFPALARLTPEEIGVLADAIEAARERRRAEVARGFKATLPGPVATLTLKFLGRARS